MAPSCSPSSGLILRHVPNYQPNLDGVFHALADPARRSMLQRLAFGPAPVSELARPLPMSLPSAMQHLGVLEDAGLVRTEKRGRVRECTLQPDRLSLAERWLTARRTEWEQRLDRLGAYLQTMNDEGA